MNTFRASNSDPDKEMEGVVLECVSLLSDVVAHMDRVQRSRRRSISTTPRLSYHPFYPAPMENHLISDKVGGIIVEHYSFYAWT